MKKLWKRIINIFKRKYAPVNVDCVFLGAQTGAVHIIHPPTSTQFTLSPDYARQLASELQAFAAIAEAL